MTGQGWQRLDAWLWCARFLRQRADCVRFVEAGLVRLNRMPVAKPHARVRVGDVLTLPLVPVRVVRVAALAERRGGAAEARLLYAELTAEGEAARCDVPGPPV